MGSDRKKRIAASPPELANGLALSESPAELLLDAQDEPATPALAGADREFGEIAGEQIEEAADAGDSLAASARRAIHQTRQWLLARQAADGSWCAELEGDTILESETILLLAFLGHEDSELARRLAAYIVEKQLPTGGWAMYPGGAIEISGSVKAYFALKLTGHSPSAEYMRRARKAILAHGGADAVNSFTRFYLALLGQISYEHCPAVPPEIVLLPKWFPVNLYAVSSWSRTIIVPLSIISAFRPVRRIEPRLGIRELFLHEPEDWPPLRCPGLSGGTGRLSWDRFFRTIDGLAKWCQRRRLLPFRRKALAAAERWMRIRFDRSDGLGAIYPPMVWSIIALKCLGYPDDSPEMQYCREELQKLVIEDEKAGTARLQPCKSPVWDTAIAVRALAASGVRPEKPAMREAIGWLLARQVKRRGDWTETVDAEPGGWAFEYANDFYPDNDDTAMVLMALQTQFLGAATRRLLPRIALGWACSVAWLTGRRSTPFAGRIAGGGAAARSGTRRARFRPSISACVGCWPCRTATAAGGRSIETTTAQFLCHVPFADHNAMIDPSTPDLAGRVLEALGQLGPSAGRAGGRSGRRLRPPPAERRRQLVRPLGRQLYLRHLAGDHRAGGRRRAGRRSGHCGGGRLAAGSPAGAAAAGANRPTATTRPTLRGQGTPTASQTAWAILGLLAAGRERHPAVARGIRYLTDDAERRRHVGRSRVHRHRLSPRVLPAIPLLSDLLPAVGAVDWAAKVEPNRQEEESRLCFSITQTPTRPCYAAA